MIRPFGDNRIYGTPTAGLGINETRLERQAKTNAEGFYSIAFIAPGFYIVSVQAPGFRVDEAGCGPVRAPNLRGSTLYRRPARCALPVSATVNGEPATVLYAGIAPGLVQGANQKQSAMVCSDQMDRVITLTTFEEQESRNEALEYWLTRPPEERIQEVERLRHEYAAFAKDDSYDLSQGLLRSLLLIEREQS